MHQTVTSDPLTHPNTKGEQDGRYLARGIELEDIEHLKALVGAKGVDDNAIRLAHVERKPEALHRRHQRRLIG